MNLLELNMQLKQLSDKFSPSTTEDPSRLTRTDMRPSERAAIIIDNLMDNIYSLNTAQTLNDEQQQLYNQMVTVSNTRNFVIETQLGLIGTNHESLHRLASALWRGISAGLDDITEDSNNLLRPRPIINVVSDDEDDTDSEDESIQVLSLTDIIYDNRIEDIFSNLQSPQENQYEEQKTQKEMDLFYNPFEGNELFTSFIAGFCVWFITTQ